MIEDIKAGPFDAFFKVEGCGLRCCRKHHSQESEVPWTACKGADMVPHQQGSGKSAS